MANAMTKISVFAFSSTSSVIRGVFVNTSPTHRHTCKFKVFGWSRSTLVFRVQS